MSDAAPLNRKLVSLHDALKALVLWVDEDFPSKVTNGLETLEVVAEVQTIVAAYSRELLWRLFQSPDIPVSASKFNKLWNEKAEREKWDGDAETTLKLLHEIAEEGRLFPEEELRAAISGDDIPAMLYYLTTIQEDLGWYSERYLRRMRDSKD